MNFKAENLVLRLETPHEYQAVENLTREAFWNVHVPGCDEHWLAHVLRDSADFIPELDYVAILGDRLVGNIMYARSRILTAGKGSVPTLTFGPVSVLPDYQGQGIGSALIRHTLCLATGLGYESVVIYGDPEYYKRFGFVAGEIYGLLTKDGYISPALMALELVQGSLNNLDGRFVESDAYSLDPVAVESFEAKFPFKSKANTPGQLRFQELLQQSRLPD